jgi:hypothetical protein
MQSRRLAWCLFCPILLLAAAPGCQAIHHDRAVTVLVRDAETKQPIATARVTVWDPLIRGPQAPREAVAQTGADGQARLRVAPPGEAGLMVEGAAPGYVYEEVTLPALPAPAAGPAPLFGKSERQSEPVIVELFAEPLPTIELVVPNGYRGLVKAEVQAADEAAPNPSQRRFSFAVSPPEVAVLHGPPLLRRVGPADYLARYADGTQLGPPAENLAGFHWLKREGEVLVFFVGTRSEYDSIRPSSEPDPEGHRPARGGTGGSGGGGRGGRGGGRRGNFAPSP